MYGAAAYTVHSPGDLARTSRTKGNELTPRTTMGAPRKRKQVQDFLKAEDWEEGREIAGVIIARQPMNFGDSTTYRYAMMQDGNAGNISFLGSKMLDGLMQAVSDGEWCAVTFTGTEPSRRGSPMRIYTVEIEDLDGGDDNGDG